MGQLPLPPLNILNPGEGKPDTAPFPAGAASHTLVLAYSVFTHLIQAHAEYYLEEVARVLAPSGVFYSTWFLFDKRSFPMRQSFRTPSTSTSSIRPTPSSLTAAGWSTQCVATAW